MDGFRRKRLYNYCATAFAPILQGLFSKQKWIVERHQMWVARGSLNHCIGSIFNILDTVPNARTAMMQRDGGEW